MNPTNNIRNVRRELERCVHTTHEWCQERERK
jgi:hypothetical protein